MKIDPAGGLGAVNLQTLSAPQAEAFRRAATAARTLSALDTDGREFTVARDPESHRFIVLVLDRATGEVIDQLPPERIVKMLTAEESNSVKAGERTQ